jgi:arylsulfatase A-like enzyme
LVLIVTADHGEAFQEHGARYHAAYLFEEMVRIPLFVSMAGAPARTVSSPVSLLDLRPTVLDLFEVADPHPGIGRSLVAYLEPNHETAPSARAIIMETGTGKRAVVLTSGLKLMSSPGGIFEIYDLKVDPKEQFNLADEHPSTGPLFDALASFFSDGEYRAPSYVRPVIRP